jgi:hypothetical protein
MRSVIILNAEEISDGNLCKILAGTNAAYGHDRLALTEGKMSSKTGQKQASQAKFIIFAGTPKNMAGMHRVISAREK